MTQDVLQNAAVLEIFQLVVGVDTADQRHALQGTVSRDNLGHHALARLQITVQAANRNLLAALQTQRLPRRAFLEAEWDNAHADQIGTVDALERLGDDSPDAEQGGTLGG